MKKEAKISQNEMRRRAKTRARMIRWTIGLAIVGAIGYAATTMSFIPYDEDDIKVVRFDDLDSKQKRTALESANAARCTCGCGMTLAQCVSTDMSCPVREPNIERIKTMVQEARGTS